MIDTDPQAMRLRVLEYNEFSKRSLYHVLILDEPIQNVIKNKNFPLKISSFRQKLNRS